LTSLRTSKLFLLLLNLAAYGLAAAVGIAVLQEVSGNIFYRLLVADVAATLVIFVIGLAARNSSLYDPYWSIAPAFLIAGFAIAGDGVIGIPRGFIVFALVVAWGWRLTWNCFARWPNLAHEDFRYRDFRSSWGPFYPIIDLFGIQIFPTLLVFAGCLPFFAIFVDGGAHWNWLDWIALFVTSGAIAIEWRADRTLWQFKKTASEGDLLQSGLWALSRHPNYFGEIAFWGGLWLFALASGLEYWWTGAGFLAMVLLFRFVSIPLMETRKALRRPGYAETVRGKPLIIPWPKFARGQKS
jgi:steroid 5-alpha reductase family enzyme